MECRKNGFDSIYWREVVWYFWMWWFKREIIEESKSNIQSNSYKMVNDYSNSKEARNKWRYLKKITYIRGQVSQSISKISYLYFSINRQECTLFILLQIFTYFLYINCIETMTIQCNGNMYVLAHFFYFLF